MKKIINGKRYDTDSATLMAEYENEYDVRSLTYFKEELYRKRSGEFFIYGSGNAGSRYSRQVEQNTWEGSEKILPISVHTAKEWAEMHLDGDKYEEIFGVVDEASEKKTVTFSLPLDVIEKIKLQAADAGCTMSDYIERLVRNN